jgi:hypothetical protein
LKRWLGVLGGRHASCRVDTLSFSQAASLPAAPRRPDEEKAQRTRELSWRKWNLRRYRAPSGHHRMHYVCSAVFFLKLARGQLRHGDFTIGRTRMNRPAAGLGTTLVLDRQAPDFSTDAGNSALIATTKSRTAL